MKVGLYGDLLVEGLTRMRLPDEHIHGGVGFGGWRVVVLLF
jgi:hypothetical protein